MRPSQRYLSAALFVLPALTLYVLFVIYPTLDALRISLYHWRGFSSQRTFAGLENFARLLGDPIYWKALLNNAEIVALTIAVALPAALLLAVAISRSGAGTRFYRVVLPFPNAMGDVAIATLWIFIYSPIFGLLNGILRGTGLGGWARGWLGSPSTALVAVTVPMIWKWVGFYTLLLLGGIYAIDREIDDAARIDGASEWQRFWSITLPLIRQNVVVAVVFMLVLSFNSVFAFTEVMTHGGNPNRATETVPSYLVEQAFQYSQFGYGSAIGVSMLVLMLVVSVFAIRQLLGEGRRA
ncbi:ABC transporter permease [Limnochorda pilosa]|uniref:ABC transporter permease n=2 Tax=Limnochorda pilosa TaxID=1555112 RepID=A0A0K2SLE9_LIMPI|nr:ABC transporter permease [Limnochorda pilosa]